MLTSQEVARNLDLLREYRQQLSNLIPQAQQYSGDDDSSIEDAAPASIVAKIYDAQEHIRRIKATLDSNGIEYVQHPLDTWSLHEPPRLSGKAPSLAKPEKYTTNVPSNKEISNDLVSHSAAALAKPPRQDGNAVAADTQSSTSATVDNKTIEQQAGKPESKNVTNPCETPNNRSEVSGRIETTSSQDGNSQSHNKFINIIILIGIFSYLASIATNVATNTIPDEWKSYLWVSWPILFFCAYLAIRLSVQQYQMENRLTNRLGKNEVRWWQFLRMIRQLWFGGPKQRVVLIACSLALMLAVGLGVAQGLRPCHWIDSQVGLGDCYAELYGPRDKINKLFFGKYYSSFDPYGYYAPIAASEDGFLYGWGKEWHKNNARIFALEHSGTVMDFADADPGRTITWSSDSQARLWDRYNESLIYARNLKLGDAASSKNSSHVDLAFNDGLPEMAISVNTGEVQVWNLSGSTRVISIETQIANAPVALSSDGKFVAIGFPNTRVKVFSVDNGTELYEVQGLQQQKMQNTNEAVNFVAFNVSKDGKEKVITVANDSIIRVWNADDGALENEIVTKAHSLSDVVVSPDGAMVALATAEGNVEIWRLDDRFLLDTLHVGEVTAMAFFPNNRLIATGNSDGTILIWYIE
jgi:WD40 repeat protein